jgi:hypothetical protein
VVSPCACSMAWHRGSLHVTSRRMLSNLTPGAYHVAVAIPVTWRRAGQRCRRRRLRHRLRRSWRRRASSREHDGVGTPDWPGRRRSGPGLGRRRCRWGQDPGEVGMRVSLYACSVVPASSGIRRDRRRRGVRLRRAPPVLITSRSTSPTVLWPRRGSGRRHRDSDIDADGVAGIDPPRPG